MAIQARANFSKVPGHYKHDMVKAWTANGNELRQGDVKAYTPNQQVALAEVKSLDALKSLIGYNEKVDSKPYVDPIQRFAA